MIFFSRKTQTPEAFGWFIPTVKKKNKIAEMQFSIYNFRQKKLGFIKSTYGPILNFKD